MTTCVVTFDQPLFAKAIEMVASADPNDPISKIFVRLGGFHLLMSFMGCIGYIMGGSGLEEALEIIYAKNSIVHIMSGHAYERAIRAHFLVHVVLTKLLLENFKFNENLTSRIEKFLDNFNITEIDDSGADELMEAIQSQFTDLSDSSKTAQLWCQYWRAIAIIKYYIRAERMGDFQLHLYSVKLMIPFFHAAGHLAYAKYAHLYLQVTAAIKILLPK